MQDSSVLLIAIAFTCMALSSSLRTLGARLALFAAGAVLVAVGLAVPVRIPVSKSVGDALDVVALLVLAWATWRTLFPGRRAARKPEDF